MLHLSYFIESPFFDNLLTQFLHLSKQQVQLHAAQNMQLYNQ